MRLFNNNIKENVISSFLNCLEVKYTDTYINKLYNEHPHKYNLYGLSKILSDYNIKNTGIRIKNKQEGIKELEVPFIAHIGHGFVVVYKITIDRVYYTWNKKNLNVTINEFCEIWSGIILYAEPDENSIEPDYKFNYKTYILKTCQKTALWITVLLILIISFINNDIYNKTAYHILTIINLIGVYICYLLVLKQINIHSEYTDKICSLFSKNDCNNILESDAAKLGGVFGWSEIGLGYFIVNTLITVCFNSLIPYMILINILALAYSFWSIWYQKFKAKQWCFLCLIVQSLLWITFLLYSVFGMIQFPEINIMNISLTMLLYLTFSIFINILVPNLGQKNKIEQITQELNSIKNDENVFLTMLKKQPHYEVTKDTSSILWGNIESDTLVTIFTNPHCGPCADMHNQVEKILSASNNVCIQYIFSSFMEELDTSSKFLSAIYFTKKEEERRKIFKEWFKQGKNLKEKFFKIHNIDIEEKQVTEEFKKHSTWKQETGLRATPTILVNGYKLPDNYKIEDIKYI